VNDLAYKKLKSLLTRTPVEHPKLGLVVQIVKGQLLKKQSSRILVFTQYRDTASYIVDQLKRLPGILVDRFVGQASRVGDKGLKQEEQVERIRMLEKGELNVLVATSIGEEGLDIPAVDHVIFYEPIPSEIRYIQRRGRTGRKSIGKVTILATNDTLDMIYLYSSRKKTEKMRSVAKNINSKLQPIIRRLPEQYRKPMDPTELERLDEEGKHQYNELKYAKAESEALKEFDRKVRRVSRILYMKLLEQGVLAADLTNIASEIECEDALPQVLTVAIEKMVKEGVVMKVDQGYAVTSAIKYADKKTYEIMIEKIYPGAAVVLVDDKWRARMTHEEYNGPRKLIKKNSRFRAAADLYRMNKTLCIRVREVTKVLN
jgi:Fanconi anemia group M protein